MPRQAPDERKQKRERPEKRERACSRSVALDEPAPAGVKLQLEDIPGEAGGALVGDSGAPPQMLTTTAVTRPAGSSAKVVQSTSLVTS